MVVTESDSHEIVFEDAQESGVRKPTRTADPTLPTEADVRDHELTHLPYRSWCRHCVRGRGEVLDHRRNGAEKETKCILLARDAKTRNSMATEVPKKACCMSFQRRGLSAEMGMEHCDVVIGHDQEPAIKDLVKEIARKRAPGRTISQESPVGSSASNGLAEGAVC